MSAWRFQIVLLTAIVAFTGSAWGIPALQLYVEGATYDETTESWVVTDGDGPIRLWCIGNTEGPGSHGDILNVRLAIAYYSADAPVAIGITPSTTGGYGGFTDPSTPSAPTLIQTVTDGSVPQLSDGGDLPSHGIYGEGVDWQEFALGDFTQNDSPIADFIGEFPTTGLHADEGQINVYEIDVSGADWFHFDLYDSTQSPTRAVFAPFSHDAEGGGNPPVPEPGTVALVGLGIVAFAASRRKKR
jgi:hypothetical protein